jgi:cytochrome c peroxidase
MRYGKMILVVSAVLVMLLCVAAPVFAAGLTAEEQLGKALFFDTDLSNPAGESCATCHAPQVGWTGPDSTINAHGSVYPGAVSDRFGNRKPPTAAYGGDSPMLYHDAAEGLWIGGMFWDGRATGWRLGDPLAEQAQGPFLNPLEQNMPSAAAVIDAIEASDYADDFEEVAGMGGAIWDDDNTEVAYEVVGRSIAAYERSRAVSAYTSKFDAWLAGKAKLTGREMKGYQLFMHKGKCGNCHVPPLFTDFTYDNLGVPRNPENPFYFESVWNPDGLDWIDVGLGGFLRSIGEPWETEIGKQKVPTLRNVALKPYPGLTKAYTHNGYFKSLLSIVHFYNTRDVAAWPDPEVATNVNRTEMGNLRLTRNQEKAIVAFMKTLSDGYRPASSH